MTDFTIDTEDRKPMDACELARTGFGPKGGVLIENLTASQCKWPLWEGVGDPHYYCGAPRAKGPYCEEHNRVGSAGRASLPKLPRGA